MHNIKLVIAYDGSTYLGWQKTRMGPSIESTLQAKIEQILQHSTSLQAASRTDTGVHAQGQVVNFLTSKTSLDLHKFCNSLNSLLPKDIVVLQAKSMPMTFHPTMDCIGKEYRYYICCGPTQLPQHRLYSWHIPSQLNINLIQQALPCFIGKHNFAAFCNVKKNAHYTDYDREIQHFEIEKLKNHRLCFRVRGNHFLYKMVRNLVGTLIDIGKGKIKQHLLGDILTSLQRSKAGVTAPAHGLFLYKIFYKISCLRQH